MNILAISNLYPPDVVGGQELLCRQAVDELRRRGHRVLVLTSVPRKPGPSEPHVLRRLSQTYVHSDERRHLRGPFWEIHANLVNPDNVYALIGTIEDFAPDLCYLWSLGAIGGIGLIATLEYMDIPWVWHLGNAHPSLLCNFNGPQLRLARAMSELTRGRYLACSETVIDSMERTYPLRERVRVIPNWVAQTRPAIDRPYFDGKMLRIVHAGRLIEEKGTFLLIEAAALLRDWGYEGFHVDIFGRGADDRIRIEIEARALGEWIALRGWLDQDDLRSRFREYDLFVFPAARNEPFGVAALEAGAEGCVPLISNVGGLSEWLVNGIDCIKAHRHAEDFAQAIRRVIEGEIALAPLSKRLVWRIDARFGLDAVMPLIESELLLTAERPPRSGSEGNGVEAFRIALAAEALLRQVAATPKQEMPSGDRDELTTAAGAPVRRIRDGDGAHEELIVRHRDDGPSLMALNRKLILTYNNFSLTDGIGAQLQRIYGIYSLSRLLGTSYLHTPIDRVDYQGLAALEANASDPDFHRQFNEVLQIDSDVSVTGEYYEMSHRDMSIDLVRQLVDKFDAGETAGRPILARVLFPYGIADRFPDCYEVCKQLSPFSSSYRDVGRLRIAMHVRRGEQMVLVSDRMLPNSYFIRTALRVAERLDSLGADYQIEIHTEVPKSAFVVQPSHHGIAGRALRGSGTIDPEMNRLEDFSALPNLLHCVNESAFDCLRSLATADVLVMSKSSFSYVAALLNKHGAVLYTPFWHSPLTSWVNVASNGEFDGLRLEKALAALGGTS